MVYAYGDSYTDGQCRRDEEERVTKTYQDCIGQHYGMEVESFGLGGCSNYDIFNMLTSNMYKHKPGDIIIVQMTAVDRENHPFIGRGLTSRVLGDQTIPYSERPLILPWLKGSAISSIAAQYLKGGKEKERARVYFEGIQYIKSATSKRERDRMINTLVEHTIDSRYGLQEYYENYFYTWIKNIGLYYLKNEITFKAYTSNFWKEIDRTVECQGFESNYPICECGHWSEDGHKVFADMVIQDIKREPKTIFHTCKYIF